MSEKDRLRGALTGFIERKFASRPSIAIHAEDIVDEAYADVLSGAAFDECKENFGYLSVACLRVAYRYWRARDAEAERRAPYSAALECVARDDFVDDITRACDAEVVLDSLDCLRDIERVVIEQRYYGDFSFAEIARRNDIKLNTVLSHHRRALEKLRGGLSSYFYAD